jgi:predicted DNA-binding protein
VKIEEDQSAEQSGKYQRTIRLTHEMAARLQAVCDHLGVNIGAYITAEIGRAVSRDEVSLSVKNTQTDALSMLARVIEEASKEEAKDANK